MSEFAINVLWKQPEEWKKWCGLFRDVTKQSKEMREYTKTACELWLMWLESDGKTVSKNFNPNSYVTRAEFGTTLSRLLYGDMNNLHTETEKQYYEWYEKHLSALKVNWIMTQTEWEWVTKNELRWYVMLMLMRSAQ